MTKVFLYCLLVALAASLLSCAIEKSGPGQIGTVSAIRTGRLERLKEKRWKALKQGSKLFTGDRLRTDEKGHAVLTLEGTGRFVIGSNTEYVLGTDSRDFSSFLHRGSVWFFSLLAPGNKMNIATTTAVCGARGTAFAVIADERGTDLCICNGVVELTPKNGRSVNVTAGKYGVVRPDITGQEIRDGGHLLAQIRKGNAGWYGICLDCHKDEKKPVDTSAGKP